MTGPSIWIETLMAAAKRPQGVLFRLRLVANNGRFRRMRLQFLSEVTGAEPTVLAQYIREAETDRPLIRAIRAAYRRWTRYIPLPTDFMVDSSGSTMFFHAVSLYALVRVMRPQIIVETGCTPGKASAFILRALERNQYGHLYTIDLPPPEVRGLMLTPSLTHSARPVGAPSNWAVPDWLRSRQTLILEAAEYALPRLLNELGSIDMFYHDSDHSYQHQRWELETAYVFLRRGGILWSDNVTANTAWRDFCESKKDLFHREFTSQGVARRVGDG
jgi:predicted O-methyltransferase YrrM